MLSEKISSDFPYESHYTDVYGSKMHYIESGAGDPILFLHGIPASSYLWRNIIPHLAALGRCIAPDLIGMGKSDKPDISYTIQDHIKYIEKFIEQLNLKKITIVMHGWGSLAGIDYAMHHENNCKGLVFYEAYLHTLTDEFLSLPYQEQLYELEEKHFDSNIKGIELVDYILPQLMLRTLKKEELDRYREPFQDKNSCKPLQQYIYEISPKNIDKLNKLLEDYSNKLIHSALPKLLLYSIPGFITTIATVMWAKDHIPNLEIAEVGEALHCAQETHPKVMGETISIWLQGVEQSTIKV